MSWNFDISQAPRGHYVETVMTSKKGEYTVTRFVPDKVILATTIAERIAQIERALKYDNNREYRRELELEYYALTTDPDEATNG